MKRNLQKGILVTSACAAFLLGNVQPVSYTHLTLPTIA